MREDRRRQADHGRGGLRVRRRTVHAATPWRRVVLVLAGWTEGSLAVCILQVIQHPSLSVGGWWLSRRLAEWEIEFQSLKKRVGFHTTTALQLRTALRRTIARLARTKVWARVLTARSGLAAVPAARAGGRLPMGLVRK